jgi:hypothetical protein
MGVRDFVVFVVVRDTVDADVRAVGRIAVRYQSCSQKCMHGGRLTDVFKKHLLATLQDTQLLLQRNAFTAYLFRL